ncbi:MAG: citrate synthase, partial [Clostridia bacterium]|nr:citrate synthase [Clostridia bacterium]
MNDLHKDFYDEVVGRYERYNNFDPSYYSKIDVKRGLRNSDGTGVVAGITKICNVHGYIVNEGE